ncbi:MAG TPA: sigma-54 dependent transcriptional regulator [Sandaracinaceae bacterium LLY-WYZ-13_1]|nr:sigma-54 dependent transcriptional regulator [Sandaracinaceae bacterium LLY-WYZ-13_1]
MAARILVCDDEAGLREMLSVLLRRAGYEVATTETEAAAVTRLRDDGPFDAVVTDLALPDGTGMDVLGAARAEDESVQVIVITAYGGTEEAVEAMRLGAYDFIQKPFRNTELLALLEKALEKRQIVGENRLLRETLDGSFKLGRLLGKSPAMRRVMDLIRRIADARTSVLLTGESGTGKEMVARAIHEEGERADGPFVVVNCGALPEALMESELFGHEKGAFTGAIQRSEGLVRAASGGTLFLDEIGELPPELQVKLLRVLQERKVRPVGSQKEVEVDLRVVAATNRDLEAEVEAGRFRQDLFYRLNVIRLHLPPLRDRTEDIPLLAEHFVEKHAAMAGKPVSLSAEARRWLVSQRYPGNIRELENVIERAVTLATGSEIVLDDLPDEGEPRRADPGDVDLTDGFDVDEYLGSIERELILRALERTGGVRTEAAKLLGVSFRSFRYRLAKYGLGEAGDEIRQRSDGD